VKSACETENKIYMARWALSVRVGRLDCDDARREERQEPGPVRHAEASTEVIAPTEPSDSELAKIWAPFAK
jgi:hypothetical protein